MPAYGAFALDRLYMHNDVPVMITDKVLFLYSVTFVKDIAPSLQIVTVTSHPSDILHTGEGYFAWVVWVAWVEVGCVFHIHNLVFMHH